MKKFCIICMIVALVFSMFLLLSIDNKINLLSIEQQIMLRLLEKFTNDIQITVHENYITITIQIEHLPPDRTEPSTEEPTQTPTIVPVEKPTEEPPTLPPTEAPMEAPTEAPTLPPTEPPTEAPTEPDNLYGRLYIPKANINVGLYWGPQQENCDKEDGAAIFHLNNFGAFSGLYIADHNNQEFGKLFDVEVGMTSYLILSTGERVDLICIDIAEGYNTNVYIKDKQGNKDWDADYLMYTCIDGPKNVLICLWNEL